MLTVVGRRVTDPLPVLVFSSLVRNRGLVYQLTRRMIVGRYRGSVFGLAWSLLIPILMLVVYTFVFGTVFRVRFGAQPDGNLNFAVVLFSGLILHAVLAECLARSPGLITNNAQYVKKVVFPLEILAWTSVLTALFQAIISIAILVAYLVFLRMQLPVTVLYTPLILGALLLLTVGVTWFLSALAVYLRDIAHLVGITATVLLFISPIFYPVDRMPAWIQSVIYLNPLSFVVEQLREVIIWGRQPDWAGLAVYYAVAMLIACAGLWFFQRVRHGFADVV